MRLVLLSGSLSGHEQGLVQVGEVQAQALLKPVDVERLVALVHAPTEAP
jgi:hypothetical protein